MNTRLILQIASVAESAYRRGFNQGVASGVTEREAWQFRYECKTKMEFIMKMYIYAPCPPCQNECFPEITRNTPTAIERLFENTPRSHKELINLIKGME